MTKAYELCLDSRDEEAIMSIQAMLSRPGIPRYYKINCLGLLALMAEDPQLAVRHHREAGALWQIARGEKPIGHDPGVDEQLARLRLLLDDVVNLDLDPKLLVEYREAERQELVAMVVEMDVPPARAYSTEPQSAGTTREDMMEMDMMEMDIDGTGTVHAQTPTQSQVSSILTTSCIAAASGTDLLPNKIPEDGGLSHLVIRTSRLAVDHTPLPLSSTLHQCFVQPVITRVYNEYELQNKKGEEGDGRWRRP